MSHSESHAAADHNNNNSSNNKNNNDIEIDDDGGDEMKKITVDPARAHQLWQNLRSIRDRINNTVKQASSSSSTSSSSPSSSSAAAAAAASSGTHLMTRTPTNPPRLVAVSKLKPVSDILALYSPPPASFSSSSSSADHQSSSSSTTTTTTATPHLHFGENYVQELLEKSRLLPRGIRWHFIGGLQSNKCAQLAREVPNLWAVESVDSVKKATLLNKGRGEALAKENDNKENDKNNNENNTTTEPLRVFVQVNTSGEDSKSGVAPDSPELAELCRTVAGDECAHLRLQGLMTIGAIARSRETTAANANEDFDLLRRTRDWVARELGLSDPDAAALELSMGMSDDFEGAIVQGSDEVRVGSTIFGVRPPKSEAKVLEHAEGQQG